MPNKASNKVKSQRAGGYHVRTGCLTCKIRHVKCDEEKPACLKCRNTGRTCDGYLQVTKRRSPRSAQAATSTQSLSQTNDFPSTEGEASQALAVAHAVQYLLPPAFLPTQTILGTPEERQCFEYFRGQLGQELSTALQLDTTPQFILQACHTDPSIKYAVIALGAMGQRLHTNHLLTSDNEEANNFQGYAQIQYCKALNHLRAQMSTNPTGFMHQAIISCFLFTIFEFLQGNDEGSLVHLKSGLNILRREIEASAGDAPDALRKEITRIFSVMDFHATEWLALPTFQAPAIMPLEALRQSVQPFNRFGADVPLNLHHFVSLEAAARALNYQIIRTYHFQRSVTAYTNSLEDIPPNVYARQQDLLEELDCWPIAIDALLSSTPSHSEEMIHRVTIMRLNYHLTSLLLSSCLQNASTPFFDHTYQPYFRQMLDLAQTLLTPDLSRQYIYHIVTLNNVHEDKVRLFSFYAGLIQPLFFIAVSTRELSMAKEAISMLQNDPWREGAWDSVSMARIAEKKVAQMKKKGYYNASPNTYIGVPFEALLESASQLTSPDIPAATSSTYSQGLQDLMLKPPWLNTSWSSPVTVQNSSTGSSLETTENWASPGIDDHRSIPTNTARRYPPYLRREPFSAEDTVEGGEFDGEFEDRGHYSA